MRTVLVTGGAGYVGSHVGFLLAKQGHTVIILDALYNQQYPLTPWATLIKGDMGDLSVLRDIFSTYSIDAVMHCAAFIDVGASVKDPRIYYDNNVVRTVQLLQSMLEHGVRRLIFSSSAAVYGNPVYIPMDEQHNQSPLSPYGMSKYMVERILQDYANAYDLQSVSLRYFNAAGAYPEEGLGELHEPETHLIPNMLAAMLEQRPCVVFGSDYATADGTCVRDFLHVRDIAQAHCLALDHLMQAKPTDLFNLGTGQGVSVKQVIQTIEQLFNVQLKVMWHKRRDGDSSHLVADARKAEALLGWRPHYSSLEYIISSAYTFMQQQRMRSRLQ